MLGGEGLVRAGAMRVGGMIGTSMGIGIATGLVGAYIGYEIYEHLSESTKAELHQWAINAGQNFVNTFIGLINVGIREINSALDEANALAIFGVDAPNIGEVGEVNFHSGLERQEAEAKSHIKNGLIDGPGGRPVKPSVPHSAGGGRGHRRGKGNGRTGLMSTPYDGRGGTGTLVLHTHFHADGRQLAELVTQHVLDAEALK
jgi:hypothetical protein